MEYKTKHGKRNALDMSFGNEDKTKLFYILSHSKCITSIKFTYKNLGIKRINQSF